MSQVQVAIEPASSAASQPRRALGERDLGPLALGDVTREAARVREFTVLPQHARIDQHVLDRTVLAAQPRGILR